MNPLMEFYNLHLHYTVNQRLFEDRCRQLLHFKGTLEQRQQLVDDTLRLSLAVTDTIDDEEAVMADTIEYIQTNEIDGGADILEAMSLIANNLKEDRARATSYSNLISRRKLGQTGQRVRQPQVANPFIPIQRHAEVQQVRQSPTIEDYEVHVRETVEEAEPVPKVQSIPVRVPVERDLIDDEPEQIEEEEGEIVEEEEVIEEDEEEIVEEDDEPETPETVGGPEEQPTVGTAETSIDIRPTCEFCGQQIKSNNELTVVDGKPIHIRCRYQMLTAGLPKNGEPEVSGDGFNGYRMGELDALAEESRHILEERVPPEAVVVPQTRKEKKAAKKASRKSTKRRPSRGLFKKKTDQPEE